MKKLLTLIAVAGFVALLGSQAMANGTPVPEAAPEGVEISGAVDVVTFYQHADKDAHFYSGGTNASGGAVPAVGGAGDYLAAGSDADDFRFLVNQVEIDLAKSFGENIRLRTDIDFHDFTNTGVATNTLTVEQAYVTANLAAGNGIEFLIGKFNAPVGVESVDLRDNWLITLAPPLRWVVPANVIGAKLYYAFSDLVDFHWAVVNDLNNNGFGDSAMPSTLFRLGFNWGDEGRKNTVGISGGLGPEHQAGVVATTTRARGENAHWDFFGDLDLMIALSDTVTLAAEGVYRQSNHNRGMPRNQQNQKVIAGFAAINYKASDVWDVSFRAGYEWDPNRLTAALAGASTTGVQFNNGYEGILVTGSMGAGYMIADAAKMKLEYRFDWARSSLQNANRSKNADYHAVLAQFAYNF